MTDRTELLWEQAVNDSNFNAPEAILGNSNNPVTITVLGEKATELTRVFSQLGTSPLVDKDTSGV